MQSRAIPKAAQWPYIGQVSALAAIRSSGIVVANDCDAVNVHGTKCSMGFTIDIIDTCKLSTHKLRMVIELNINGTADTRRVRRALLQRLR